MIGIRWIAQRHIIQRVLRQLFLHVKHRLRRDFRALLVVPRQLEHLSHVHVVLLPRFLESRFRLQVIIAIW